LYYLIKGVAEQLIFTCTILKLGPAAISYDPLHEDQSGGLRALAEPALDFLQAMALLFIAFILFFVYDILIFKIHESRRLWAIAVYAAIAFPLFLLPVLHLHHLMKEKRRELHAHALAAFKKQCGLDEGGSALWDAGSYKESLEQIVAAREIGTWLSTTPAWPLPTATLVRAGTYMIGVLAPLATKVAPLVIEALGFSSP
jgi:hypothetical protein